MRNLVVFLRRRLQAGGTADSRVDNVELENGFNVLLENGSFLLLE